MQTLTLDNKRVHIIFVKYSYVVCVIMHVSYKDLFVLYTNYVVS